jgi:hypothetical protein
VSNAKAHENLQEIPRNTIEIEESPLTSCSSPLHQLHIFTCQPLLQMCCPYALAPIPLKSLQSETIEEWGDCDSFML